MPVGRNGPAGCRGVGRWVPAGPFGGPLRPGDQSTATATRNCGPNVANRCGALPAPCRSATVAGGPDQSRRASGTARLARRLGHSGLHVRVPACQGHKASGTRQRARRGHGPAGWRRDRGAARRVAGMQMSSNCSAIADPISRVFRSLLQLGCTHLCARRRGQRRLLRCRFEHTWNAARGHATNPVIGTRQREQWRKTLVRDRARKWRGPSPHRAATRMNARIHPGIDQCVPDDERLCTTPPPVGPGPRTRGVRVSKAPGAPDWPGRVAAGLRLEPTYGRCRRARPRVPERQRQ
jgi:hypothetical protein